MSDNLFFWVGFLAFVTLMLVLDLGVFHRKMHKVPLREALIWSVVWITLAMLFMAVIYWDYSSVSAAVARKKVLEYLTGYLIEYSLSVDNIFVFILIFSYFAVDEKVQHKVLFWGIIGALVMRAIFIFAGVALINRFHWIIYVFGVFLIYTGGKMFLDAVKGKTIQVEPEKNPVIKFARRFMRISEGYSGPDFFIRIDKKLFATPLFLVLLIVESSDLIFAVDSIPAVLAITQDPFIVFTSNIFAILGLRSLYFAVSGIMVYFKRLKIGLALVLAFIGSKMILADFIDREIPVFIPLIIVVLILSASVIWSVIENYRAARKQLS
ncbi:MAG TPA: TerC family protein [Bacteroidales bacterium]|nr:TerC family protein [Bacteroidales bacterium]